jgi:hypothetical protein
MSIDAKSATRAAGTAAPAGLARVRRGSLAVLVLVVAEYLIGMYVNLFVTIPRPTMATASAPLSRTGRPSWPLTP